MNALILIALLSCSAFSESSEKKIAIKKILKMVEDADRTSINTDLNLQDGGQAQESTRNTEILGDYYIGNGGEGVQASDQLFLRDLYDNNIHLTPYFGRSPDSKIVLPASLIETIKVNPILLRQKLTDLNGLSPNLGYYVLTSIQFYKWIFLDETSLTPVPNDGSTLATYASRVTIANRLHNTIRIYTPHWNQLNEEHKVALIIHEAISGMVRPICHRPNDCYQRGDIVRSLVSTAFTKPDQRNDARILMEWETYLNIPPRTQRSPCVRTTYEVQGKIGIENFVLVEADNQRRREIFFRAFCSKALENPEGQMQLNFLGPSFTVIPHSYTVHQENAAPYSNIFIWVADHRSFRRQLNVTHVMRNAWGRDRQICERILEKEAVTGFEAEPMAPSYFDCPDYRP